MTACINEKWHLQLPPYRAYRKSWAWHEAARLAAMHEVISPGSIVYEIGAEEGDYGALFTSWGADVVLVEPNPKAWPSIKASFEANSYRPEAWWVGFLSDHDWRIPDDEIRNRFSRTGWPTVADEELIPEHGFQHLAEHGEVTPAWTLDQLVYRTGRVPNVVSVDVEGGELHVLTGGQQTLREHHPVVFVSVHPEFLRDLYSSSADEVYELMADLGYERTFLAIDHEWHEKFEWVGQ